MTCFLTCSAISFSVTNGLPSVSLHMASVPLGPFSKFLCLLDLLGRTLSGSDEITLSGVFCCHFAWLTLRFGVLCLNGTGDKW